MSSSGPRSELLLLTFASVHGLRLALAAWNRGAPGAATWNVSCSCFASSSLRAFAQPYLNCSTLSVTARFQLAGFPSTGEADFNEEIGSGSTPRKGAGSIATVAADNPRPAMICASSPPNECPTTAGFLFSFPITSPTWSATRPIFFPAKTSGWALASSTVSGSSGQPGATGAKPAWSKTVAQRSQLLASSHSPWMKTTGVRADEFAASTCPDSRAVSVAMPANLAAPSSAGSEAAAPRYHQPPWPSAWMVQSPTSKGASRLQHEEERRAEGRVSSSAGRRKDQRTRRLAGQDPLQASRPNQTGRPGSG